MYPARRQFVLLCHQRSGSNALDSWLSAHPRAGLYGQLFNDTSEYRRNNAADLGLPLFRSHPESLRHFGLRPPLGARLDRLRNVAARREHDLDAYLAAFRERFGRHENWLAAGFKLHDHQLVDADLERLLERHVDAVVLLSRRNLLKAAVSWAYAVRTRVWASRDRGGTAAADKPVLRLDPREISWFVDKSARELARWRTMLEAREVPWLDLEYEGLVEAGDTAALLDFLGLEPHPAQRFATRRLAAPDYAHVANARELDARFGGAAHGRLFEPASNGSGVTGDPAAKGR